MKNNIHYGDDINYFEVYLCSELYPCYFFLVSLPHSWWRFLEISECYNKLTFISIIAWLQMFTHSANNLHIFVLAGLYLNLSPTKGYIILDYHQRETDMYLWYPLCLTSNKTSKCKIFLYKIVDFGKEKVVADRGYKNQAYKLNR